MAGVGVVKRKRKSYAALILAACVFLGTWYFYDASTGRATPPGQIAVHFIDVGQGDCTLIEAQGQFMLIDGGQRGSEERVTKYLRALGVERLDYVVATHPHSDHTGGLAYGVLDAFPVGTVIAPRLSQENTPTTQTWEAFLEAVSRQVDQNGARALYANPGDIYALGDAVFTILGPLGEDLRNMNNNSVIVRLEYGSTAALFTGDAERAAESALASTYHGSLRADLLHAGHHGSNTSSNLNFLRYVVPRFVVIPVGAENTYNHPDPRAMQRFREANTIIYRTDVDGTIIMRSNGLEFWRDS